jgi:tripartite-type tricarboxylate transporter receptor subunit TctC
MSAASLRPDVRRPDHLAPLLGFVMIVSSDEVKKRIIGEGGDPVASTPEEYAANIEREEGKWAALIKKLGLKVQ